MKEDFASKNQNKIKRKEKKTDQITKLPRVTDLVKEQVCPLPKAENSSPLLPSLRVRDSDSGLQEYMAILRY